MITIKEIAGIAGVSTTTVSNVIHGKTKEVSPATVERIQRVLEKYHYTPNISARNLASNKSGIIGVIMKRYRDMENNRFVDPFVSELLGGIESSAKEKGYYVMVYTACDIQELKKLIMSWNMDGMVMVGFVRDEIYSIQEVCRRPMAIIDVYNTLRMENCINIGLEDGEGMYRVVQYIISCGHKKIGFLSDNDTNLDHERYLGYERAMRESGIFVKPEDFIHIVPAEKNQVANLEEIYKRSFEFTALACVSDYYAALILNELQDRGRKVPEDVSITGFDDNYMSQIVRPALTTVRQDAEKRGQAAVEYLCAMIEEPEKRQYRSRIFPAELVIRDSVRKIENITRYDPQEV